MQCFNMIVVDWTTHKAVRSEPYRDLFRTKTFFDIGLVFAWALPPRRLLKETRDPSHRWQDVDMDIRRIR